MEKVNKKNSLFFGALFSILILLLQTGRIDAFTETTSGEVTSSQIGDFIPTRISDATLSDINNYFSGEGETIRAADIGLGSSPNGGVSIQKIENLIGAWLANQGGTYGLWGWSDGKANKYCLKAYPVGSLGYYWVHCFDFKTQEGYKISCSHQNTHNYSFDYQRRRIGETDWKTSIDKSFPKCNDIGLSFSLIGDFAANLIKNLQTGGQITITNYLNYPIQHVPPTDIAECSGQNSCLSQAKEYEIPSGSGNYAKGVMEIPSGFISIVEKGIRSNNEEGLPCGDGICRTKYSGSYILTTKVPRVIYHGQCREGNNTVVVPDENIPEMEKAIGISVYNSPPISTVNFEKKYLSEGETTKAYCDVADPDDCSDKIVKIKWKCMDSQGNDNNCFFLDGNQVFRQGELYKEITPTNPYRDTVDLKLNKKETYSITCEAWDNDNANALSGAGINSIKVGDPVCIADGTCNSKCPGDPDCGVIPAGSCYVTRIKPAFDIKKIKPSTKVTFEAKIFGSIAPQKYTWFCDKNEPVSEDKVSTEKTDNHTCTNYTLDNHTYEPKVVVTYPNGETKECANNEGTAVTTDGLAPSQVGFCIVVPDEGGTDNSACGDKATAKLKAYTNYDLDNPIYQWSNCPGAENKANVTCNYETSKLQEKFTPALTIVNDGKEIKCPSNTSVTLYKESSCKVLSRVKGSGEDYAKNPASRVGDVLETKIERKCLDPKEIISWEAVGTSLQKSNNDSAEASLNSAGNVTIKAKVKVGDKFVDCEESSTDVKQMIQEGV